MQIISPVKTKRINATLSELSIRNAIYLCKLPKQHRERGATELLNRIVDHVERPLPGQVASPKMWTFQEREFVVAHYMSHVLDGGPNFPIGKNGCYLDYLSEKIGECPEYVEAGIISGQTWYLRPMLGGYLESIERLIIGEELPNDSEGWIIGAMACQLFCEDDEKFDLENSMDALIDEHVEKLANRLLDLHESEFIELMKLYMDKISLLDHIFSVQITDSGFVLLPINTEVPDLPPARFYFSLAVREFTESIFGEPNRGSDGADAVLQSASAEHDEPAAIGGQSNIREQGIRYVEESS